MERGLDKGKTRKGFRMILDFLFRHLEPVIAGDAGDQQFRSLFSAIAKFRVARATARDSSVQWAELAPQQVQSSSSWSWISRRVETVWIDSSYSLAVPCKEHPDNRRPLSQLFPPTMVSL